MRARDFFEPEMCACKIFKTKPKWMPDRNSKKLEKHELEKNNLKKYRVEARLKAHFHELSLWLDL